MISYIIGINFGHNETTASYYDLQLNCVKNLILDDKSTSTNKVESAIFRNVKTGEWQIARDFRDCNSPDFARNFIVPVNEMTYYKTKEAFAIFVKLVFVQILKNQSFLCFNEQTGERNFEVYVSCPFGFVKDEASQIRDYKKFFTGIIPIEWIISDSMATYFKIKEERSLSKSSVLLIDIDSLLINFVAYDENGKLTYCNDYRHGNSAIENLIYEYFEKNDADFNKAKQEGEALCARSDISWRNCVIDYIKRQKDGFYDMELSSLFLDLSNRQICNANAKERVFDCFEILKGKLEIVILAPYRQTLLNDINDVKHCLANEIIGMPEVVVLTGAASHMPWLLRLVKESFPDSCVYRENMISVGLAYYGEAIHKMKPAMEELKTAIATVFHEFNLQSYSTMFTDYVISRMQEFLEDEHMLEYAKENTNKQKETIRLIKN
ncbi:hypothetical protein [uncultured Prevotella sp.]|uniref:hypothetical protein n=1 Tax=uncultured Prevotella sp. TaxID=159272 RepID=UPI0027E29CB4|nr:hypothetical protein [uncultured Prevotella sp.]